MVSIPNRDFDELQYVNNLTSHASNVVSIPNRDFDELQSRPGRLTGSDDPSHASNVVSIPNRDFDELQ